MKKRVLTLILSCVMLFALFVVTACQDGESEETKNTEVKVDDGYPDYLRDKTYDGATVRLLVATEALSTYFQEEDSEDNVEVAVYNRNLKVMERHKVELEYVPSDGPTVMNNTMLALVQGGDQTYDIFSPSYWWQTGNAGIATNLANIEVFDFSQPWWFQGWNDALTYADGSMYYCTGAATRLAFTGTAVIFMNKTVFNDVSNGYLGASVEDIHHLVLEGGWTKDVMLEYVKLFGSDLDYNNVLDENDAYGHITAMGAETKQLAGWGVTLSYEEYSGNYEWNFFTNGFLEKYEAYGKLLKNNNSTLVNDWLEWPYEAFSNNRVLFLSGPLNAYGTLRKGEAEYTILPLTKYDEKQSEYISMSYGAILTGIPGCLIEVDRAAVILEAMNYEDYQSVIPEIKETTLKNKVANDEGTKKMLDLIYTTTTTDFAYIHNERLKLWSAVMTGTNPNITSAYFKNEEMYNQLLNDVMNDES